MVARSKIILMADGGLNNRHIAGDLRPILLDNGMHLFEDTKRTLESLI